MKINVEMDISVEDMTEDEMKDNLIMIVADLLTWGQDPKVKVAIRSVSYPDCDAVN